MLVGVELMVVVVGIVQSSVVGRGMIAFEYVLEIPAPQRQGEEVSPSDSH